MNEKLGLLIKSEKEILETLTDKKAIFIDMQKIEKYDLAFNIIEKITGIHESVINEKVSLIETYASVRYILETLIQTELLIREPSYTFKLYYSIYNHQLDKYDKFIKRIKEEIRIMGEYEKKDETLRKKMVKNVSLDKDPSHTIKEHHKAQKILDDDADLEFTMFTPDYKSYGYGFTQHLLKTKVLPEYQKSYKDIQESTIRTAKNIVKQDRISKWFNFNKQHSKVFKEFKDKRSWKKKAEETNLIKEYELVYDLSSAILHSTSYSYNTNNEVTDSEKDIALKLILKYSKKINFNLNKYLNIELFSKLVVINVE